MDFARSAVGGEGHTGDLGVLAGRRWIWRNRCPWKKALVETLLQPRLPRGQGRDRCLNEVRKGIREGSQTQARVG